MDQVGAATEDAVMAIGRRPIVRTASARGSAETVTVHAGMTAAMTGQAVVMVARLAGMIRALAVAVKAGSSAVMIVVGGVATVRARRAMPNVANAVAPRADSAGIETVASPSATIA